MDAEQIKQAVHAALNERDGLDRETHHAHHEYLRQRIAHEERRDFRRVVLHDKIKATVVGGLLLLILGGATTALYNVGRFVIDLYQKSQTGH
ncbi:MAG: hypothetical protein AAB304_03210 [Pseudomonadota bacterium]